MCWPRIQPSAGLGRSKCRRRATTEPSRRCGWVYWTAATSRSSPITPSTWTAGRALPRRGGCRRAPVGRGPHPHGGQAGRHRRRSALPYKHCNAGLSVVERVEKCSCRRLVPVGREQRVFGARVSIHTGRLARNRLPHPCMRYRSLAGYASRHLPNPDHSMLPGSLRNYRGLGGDSRREPRVLPPGAVLRLPSQRPRNIKNQGTNPISVPTPGPRPPRMRTPPRPLRVLARHHRSRAGQHAHPSGECLPWYSSAGPRSRIGAPFLPLLLAGRGTFLRQ